MNISYTSSVRQWGQLAGIVLFLTAALIITLAVILPAAALGLAIAAVVVVTSLVARQMQVLGQAARRVASGEPAFEEPVQPTLRVELPDGEVMVARPVAIPQTDEHTMLLTRNGYLMVNGRGEVFHRL
ncbi:hypothetical protein EYB53_024920 [Candidatus Chloroploca sp. M-50]|uniref:NfeD-like C-terminal domain-containing protein n=1 Tax=Candidatus Chloroploca mongolica TaxID=2528176 RepID=A0ABS4DHQ8_9CHLR|nr:hypothetical protein [Candidatus Chloroploca mongolica]MBP1468975.1 hypothetical protein [Candidatus Chloroploca mongolica]